MDVGVDSDDAPEAFESRFVFFKESFIAVFREVTGQAHCVAKAVALDLSCDEVAGRAVLHKVEDRLTAERLGARAELLCELISA